MRKLLLLSIVCVGFLSSGATKTGQILLLNKTGKSVVLSLSFFHHDAQKEMKIRDFMLGSLEKTKFPQDKDVHVANPTKLKVKGANGATPVSLTFDKEDPSVHDLEIVEYKGALKLVQKTPAEPNTKMATR